MEQTTINPKINADSVENVATKVRDKILNLILENKSLKEENENLKKQLGDIKAVLDEKI